MWIQISDFPHPDCVSLFLHKVAIKSHASWLLWPITRTVWSIKWHSCLTLTDNLFHSSAASTNICHYTSFKREGSSSNVGNWVGAKQQKYGQCRPKAGYRLLEGRDLGFIPTQLTLPPPPTFWFEHCLVVYMSSSLNIPVSFQVDRIIHIV